jgi:hypothetical protein
MNVTNRTQSPPKIHNLQIKPRVSANKRQIEQNRTNSTKTGEQTQRRSLRISPPPKPRLTRTEPRLDETNRARSGGGSSGDGAGGVNN